MSPRFSLARLQQGQDRQAGLGHDQEDHIPFDAQVALGMTAIMNPAISKDGETVLLPRFGILEHLSAIERRRVTMIIGVRVLFRAMSEYSKLSRYDLLATRLEVAENPCARTPRSIWAPAPRNRPNDRSGTYRTSFNQLGSDSFDGSTDHAAVRVTGRPALLSAKSRSSASSDRVLTTSAASIQPRRACVTP